MERGPLHFDTIVIGAGISGLACARRLFQHDGWRAGGRLCVLEARDRIGGRVESVNVHNCRLDTGANWIHGIGTDEDPNPLMAIVPDKRVRRLSGSVVFRPPGKSSAAGLDEPEGQDDDWVRISAPVPPSSSPGMSSSDLVIPSDAAGKLSSAMWRTVGALHQMSHETSASECKQTPVLAAIGKLSPFRKAFADLDPKYHHALRCLPQFVESMEAAPLNKMSAESAQDRPGMSLLEFKIDDFDGEQVFLQDGYAAVAQEIGNDLIDADVVHRSVEVQQILRHADHITILTSKGTYTANSAVCSLPLGVLKERHEDLFQPSLPADYIDAIECLGFGTLDKIFLVYSHAWWAEEPYKSILDRGKSRSPISTQMNASTDQSTRREPDSFIGFTTSLSGLEIDLDGNVKEGSRMLSVMNLHSLTGFPVLSSFISCANARHVETCSDEQAGDMLHNELTTWFGEEPPRPEAVHVTRWASDPLSRGSYSHMITGLSERKHREQFQQPLCSKKGATLHFAGEHTSSDHFATVHGALISGWDAADAIMSERGLVNSESQLREGALDKYSMTSCRTIPDPSKHP